MVLVLLVLSCLAEVVSVSQAVDVCVGGFVLMWKECCVAGLGGKQHNSSLGRQNRHV